MDYTVDYDESSSFESTKETPTTYQKLFWLFIFFSIVGVVFEGMWCKIMYGSWETHVVSLWGPFCIIYGLGAIGCYVGNNVFINKPLVFRFLAFSIIGSAIEYVSGWLLDHGLNMYAWDYRNDFLNIHGYVCLKMAVIWGVLGICFGFAARPIDRALNHISGKKWKYFCIAMTVFMVINLLGTAACLIRWSRRHEGLKAGNFIERMIDKSYNDSTMEERFCEWHFFE